MSHEALGNLFLDSVCKRFENLKQLGDGALAQVRDDEYHHCPTPESPSLAVIIQHMHGNMLSRWTDFLTSDGEKATRDRDGEFEEQQLQVAELRSRWEAGWACLLDTLASLTPEDLVREIHIRGQGLRALDAIERQLAHYGYHVGQIVYIARMYRDATWQSLSIPKGQSQAYVPTPRD